MVAFDLRGRVAIVTGGTTGIGLGMARGLAEAGADVVVVARDPTRADKATTDLQRFGRRCQFVQADVRDEENFRTAVRTASETLGRVDILINAAGITYRKRPEALSNAEWSDVLDVNLGAAFRCAKAVYPYMQSVGGGKIVNIGSIYSRLSAPFTAAYASSKGGLVQLTRTLAVAWARDNIQVNIVLPGWVDTDLTKSARAEVEGLHERVITRTPAARWGSPGDFGGVAVFLSSAGSDFITGAEIMVDGGYSIVG